MPAAVESFLRINFQKEPETMLRDRIISFCANKQHDHTKHVGTHCEASLQLDLIFQK